MPLTPKQKRFVDEYLIDLNATQAAIRSGYSKRTAKSVGSENLTKPDVAAAVAEKQRKLAEKAGITVERVVEELAKIGFANMADYARVEGGNVTLDFSTLTREQAAVLSEVTVEEVDGGKRRVKFKLHDKRAALVDLGKHLGMFKEVHEHRHTVTDARGKLAHILDLGPTAATAPEDTRVTH